MNYSELEHNIVKAVTEFLVNRINVYFRTESGSLGHGEVDCVPFPTEDEMLFARMEITNELAKEKLYPSPVLAIIKGGK